MSKYVHIIHIWGCDFSLHIIIVILQLLIQVNKKHICVTHLAHFVTLNAIEKILNIHTIYTLIKVKYNIEIAKKKNTVIIKETISK